MVGAHVVNCSTYKRLRQKNFRFKASLSYIAKLSLRK